MLTYNKTTIINPYAKENLKMLKWLTKAISIIISLENYAAFANSCPEDLPQRLINNTWFEASGFIET
ncbi:MAG UNVERIFIED_CONTAM: hypothetical protein LVR29_09360 [Microcystis novacekii LVE1205-3]|jgi:hypothetical protein